jgi:hypothetical protein
LRAISVDANLLPSRLVVIWGSLEKSRKSLKTEHHQPELSPSQTRTESVGCEPVSIPKIGVVVGFARPLLSLVIVVTNSGHLLGYFRALQRVLIIIDSDLRSVDTNPRILFSG